MTHTKDEALKLALEALEESLYATTAKSQLLAFEAITAIKQALANAALDRKAENARELGLDYEPAPVQEPVAFFHPNQGFYWARPTKITAPATVDVEPLPLYTTPPAAQPKPVPDAIHHTDLSETLEYIQGWNDCRAEMLKGMK